MLERDVWATANLMIKRFGDDAAIEAAMRADKFATDGDLAGSGVWRRIKRCIEMLSGAASSGTVH